MNCLPTHRRSTSSCKSACFFPFGECIYTAVSICTFENKFLQVLHGSYCESHVVSVLQLYLSSSCICPPVVSVLQLYLSSSCICPPVVSVLQLYLSSSCICPSVVSVHQLYLSSSCICPSVVSVHQLYLSISVVSVLQSYLSSSCINFNLRLKLIERNICLTPLCLAGIVG